MSTRPGSRFRTEPTGRQLRVMLMAACGANVRFMAQAEGCSYDTIKALCWRHAIKHARMIAAPRLPPAKAHRAPSKPEAFAVGAHLDAWMHAGKRTTTRPEG